MFGLKTRTWVIGGVVAALLGTGAFAAAKYHHATPEQRAAWASDRIAGRLDLDDAQKAAFGKVAQKYVEIRGTTPEFMLSLTGKLKELASDDTLSVEEVNALRDEIKTEFDRRADILIPDFVSFYNTLNDKQRGMVMARLDMMAEHIEERGARMGHGFGRDGGGMEGGREGGMHRGMQRHGQDQN